MKIGLDQVVGQACRVGLVLRELCEELPVGPFGISVRWAEAGRLVTWERLRMV